MNTIYESTNLNLNQKKIEQQSRMKQIRVKQKQKQKMTEKIRFDETQDEKVVKRKKLFDNNLITMIKQRRATISSQLLSSSQKIRDRIDNKSTSSIKNKKTLKIKKRIKKSNKRDNFIISINKTILQNITNNASKTRSSEISEC